VEPGPEWQPKPIGKFKLYTTNDGLKMSELLYDCPIANTGHTIGTMQLSGCECLGYASLEPDSVASNSQTPLVELQGNTTQNSMLPQASQPTSSTCFQYSKNNTCVATKRIGPR
jgi:hypothetical protein